MIPDIDESDFGDDYDGGDGDGGRGNRWMRRRYQVRGGQDASGQGGGLIIGPPYRFDDGMHGGGGFRVRCGGGGGRVQMRGSVFFGILPPLVVEIAWVQRAQRCVR